VGIFAGVDLHDTRPPYLWKSLGKGFQVDYMGFGLLALGLGSLEIVLDEGQRNDWFSSNYILAFAILTVASLIGVVVWELRQKQPVIDFHVLKERNFALATASMLVLGFVLYGSTALLPLFLQTLLGYTAMLSGMVLSPGGIVICIAMPVVGILLRRYQARWLVIFGVVVSAAGLIAMSHFHAASGYAGGSGANCAELRPGVSVRSHQYRWPSCGFPASG
jgi:DHA2 family multidrug resistance protein